MAIDVRRIEVIDDQTVAILRRMSPQERVRRGLEMATFARALIRQNVIRMNPDWAMSRVSAEVTRRFGRE